MSANAGYSVAASRKLEQHDPRIQNLLRVIESDPSHNIPSLSRLLHLSSSRLSHLFKRDTGCSLHRFLTQCRLDQAATLLQRTDTPVKEISYSVGYSHPPSFARAFRNRFGCSPNDYRAKVRILSRNS